MYNFQVICNIQNPMYDTTNHINTYITVVTYIMTCFCMYDTEQPVTYLGQLNWRDTQQVPS